MLSSKSAYIDNLAAIPIDMIGRGSAGIASARDGQVRRFLVIGLPVRKFCWTPPAQAG
jgi:hypothetical protein